MSVYNTDAEAPSGRLRRAEGAALLSGGRIVAGRNWREWKKVPHCELLYSWLKRERWLANNEKYKSGKGAIIKSFLFNWNVMRPSSIELDDYRRLRESDCGATTWHFSYNASIQVTVNRTFNSFRSIIFFLLISVFFIPCAKHSKNHRSGWFNRKGMLYTLQYRPCQRTLGSKPVDWCRVKHSFYSKKALHAMGSCPIKEEANCWFLL